MKNRYERDLEAARRGLGWCNDHPDVIQQAGTSVPALPNQVATLKVVVDRIGAQGATQVTAKVNTTLDAHDEKALREDLRDLHIGSIVDVAETLRSTVPGIGELTMPPKRSTSQKLIDAAVSMHDRASVYRDVLIANGLPTDFLDQLAAATTVLRDAVDARGAARSTMHEATEGVKSDLTLAKDTLTKINASLKYALKSQQPLFASWQQAKRVVLKPGFPRSSSDTSGGTATSANAGAGGNTGNAGVVPGSVGGTIPQTGVSTTPTATTTVGATPNANANVPPNTKAA